jgi:hypothetical protein
MTVCTKHACQTKVHAHRLEPTMEAVAVSAAVRTTPQMIEVSTIFGIRWGIRGIEFVVVQMF